MTSQPHDDEHVMNRWDGTVADGLAPVERLPYRSNLLGADQRLTNTGGGNTSSKVRQPDPLTGEPVKVLWVKGSGGDLRTATRANFASLSMDKLRGLQNVYDRAEVKGVKTESEDAMVDMDRHATFNLNSLSAPSTRPYRRADWRPILAVQHALPAPGAANSRFAAPSAVVRWPRPTG